jgi:hypothetical protein
MVLRKKGLAEIITVILIILLSLAAIAIIWQVIKPVILKTSSQISLVCLNMDLQVTSANCTSAEFGDEDTIWKIRVERGVGEGDIKSIKFSFSSDEETKTIDWNRFDTDADGEAVRMPDELDVILYKFNPDELEIPTDANKIRIAPVVEGEGGEELSCPIASERDCSKQ